MWTPTVDISESEYLNVSLKVLRQHTFEIQSAIYYFNQLEPLERTALHRHCKKFTRLPVDFDRMSQWA
ncbi:hypothetical protein BGZ97_011114 [Linnemannia gamsii]|uniref:Uncharacterized protein n=1 Tax=Linnemannia gamsii TaxID=64522 RepID=A0A9P6R8U8_9FUNG|nr:hypothetical protein BGZ97_011114 [Linnemannia gamsii]